MFYDKTWRTVRLHTKVCISFCLDAAFIFLQFKWLDKSFLVALAYFVIRWAHEKLTIVGFLHARKYKRRKGMRWEKPSPHRTWYSNWKTLFWYLKILAYKLILPGIKILQVRGAAHFEKRMRELLPDRIHNSYYCIGPEVVKKGELSLYIRFWKFYIWRRKLFATSFENSSTFVSVYL